MVLKRLSPLDGGPATIQMITENRRAHVVRNDDRRRAGTPREALRLERIRDRSSRQSDRRCATCGLPALLSFAILSYRSGTKLFSALPDHIRISLRQGSRPLPRARHNLLTWDRTLPRSKIAFAIRAVRLADDLRALTLSPLKVGGGAVRGAERTGTILPQHT